MQGEYHPLLDTLRLYAGWLLALLFVILSVGSYTLLYGFPLQSDLLFAWVTSPLILQVAFLAFFFLLFSSVHRRMNGGLWKGILLTLLGFILFIAFRVNL